MTPEVSEAMGHVVSERRIGRLMREHGLQSHKRRRFRVVEHGLQARTSGSCQHFGARLRGDGAQPEVVGRHDLRRHR